MADTPDKMYVLAVLLTFVAMVAIGLRFYTRHIKKAKYSYDDYMILPAMVSISMLTHCACPTPRLTFDSSLPLAQRFALSLVQPWGTWHAIW